MSNDQAQHKDSDDLLANLPDRNHFFDALNDILQQPNSDKNYALLLLDVDDFLDMNLRFGYLSGDKILDLFVKRVQQTLDENVLLARLNGDEFAILVPDMVNIDDVERISTKILEGLVEPFLIKNKELMIHASIGSTLVTSELELEHLMQYAEIALSEAKQGGKYCFRHFAPEMNKAVKRRLAISQHLLLAEHTDFSDFYLNYQPKIDLATGELQGVEALLRWHCPDFGEVSPLEFIPIAEQNGVIIVLGEWVLFEACQQAKQWKEQFNVDVPIAVNFSAKQFKSAGIALLIERVLHETNLEAHLLEVELTESALFQNVSTIIEALKDLKELGIKIAVDDFGTGYSSLSYLKDFPLDYLKVDRSFVMQTPHLEKEVSIVKLIINMAHLLGLKVIAEGVENSEQYHFLLAEDCDEMQGYLFSRPLSAESISALLGAGSRPFII
jgi:diguanylate cyclase (GGDEF)-like protein